MMKSTFHGLETAKRSLFVHNTMMQTAGHNISNTNTDGYSRQRVNISAADPFHKLGMQRLEVPGQLGTGVKIDDVVRLRDIYMDARYRRENSGQGEWSVREKNLRDIEKVLNEPSENGLRAVMDQFWDSWEVLNRDPSLLSARVDVIGKATNFVDTLNHVGVQLNNLDADADNNILAKLEQANGIITNIAQLTYQIQRQESFGDHANDFRDQRDLLVDQLSGLIDIQVVEGPDSDYQIIAGGVNVVNNDTATLLDVGSVNANVGGELAGFVRAKEDVQLIRNELNAMVEALVNGKVTVTIPNGYTVSSNMVAASDVTLKDGTTIPKGTVIPTGSVIDGSFEVEVNGFNGLHQMGYGLGTPAANGVPFFVNNGGPFTIDNIRLNQEVASDTNKIAASGIFESIDGVNTTIKGNSSIAFAISRLRDTKFEYASGLTNMTNGTTDDYFRAITGGLGTIAENATRNYKVSKDLVEAIQYRRFEVSGVSLDEEMTDLIKFQHAYNAAARNITMIDEMLDKVINGMGVVGR